MNRRFFVKNKRAENKKVIEIMGVVLHTIRTRLYTHKERNLLVSPAKMPSGSTLSSGASEIYL